MRRTALAGSLVLGLVAALAPLAPAVAQEEPASTVLAGAASVDSTWHVGASAGQYASADSACVPNVGCAGLSVGDHGVDPFLHQTRRSPSYGIEGREWARALVIEGPSVSGDGRQRYAVVSNDLYIPQDLVNRRVEAILEDHDRLVALGLEEGPPTGITADNMTVSVSHSHSSPYYSTPSWGVWAFQDVFDIRHFEHIAQKMAQAVIEASRDMVPVRMGAASIPFTVDGSPDGISWLKKHSYGPVNSGSKNGNNDGSPAGYPRTDTDRDLAVVRFDDVSDPARPTPLATWVVWGDHPEHLDGNDLLTGEYVNTMYRIVDREIGGVTLFSQNDTGTGEAADHLNAHPPHLRQEFSHAEYNQVERMARTLADGVKEAWQAVAAGAAGQDLPRGYTVIPFSTDFPVGVKDLRFAPPGYRALPTVSSCRTERAFDGNPGVPIVGLPDCGYFMDPVESEVGQLPFDPGVTYDQLRALCEDGVAAACVPDNVGAPSYTGLQETFQVHLQAVRLGDVGITVCPCEQWADQSRNIKTRLDLEPGNLWYGWDWTANHTDPGWEPGVIYDGKDLPGHGPLTLNDWCIPEDGGWSCRNPANPAQRLTIGDETFRRMKAHIYNDARGWDELPNAFQAETEPIDVDRIWGNYTHEELTEHGYPLVLTVGMSNDYWGYIATYREFQRGDHYRKALTGLGPHSSDFLATRLSRMAAELNGGPPVELTPKDLAYAPESEHQRARARVLGLTAGTYLAVYETQLPADGGAPAITSQPEDIQRFAAARVAWIGGSNYVDTPLVSVERCVRTNEATCDPDDPSHWETYADGFGEVQVRVHYPQIPEVVPWRLGTHEWRWEATFEAFDSDIDLPDAQGVRRDQTPDGTYRFVIEGCRREAVPGQTEDPRCPSHELANRVTPYRLVSDPFRVSVWDGITVEDLRIEDDGRVSFEVGPPYLSPEGEEFLPSYSNTDEIYDYTTSNAVDYPNSSDSPFPFIHDRMRSSRQSDNDIKEYDPSTPLDDEVFCFHCSFRPWADTGAVRRATVTIRLHDGGTRRVPAGYELETGRWVTDVRLRPRDRAFVARGGIVDHFGERNGERSDRVTG